MLRWWPDLLGWIFYTTLPLWPGVTPRFERIARFAPVIGVFIGGAQAALWLLGRELGVPSASAPCWCWPWGCGSRAVCTSTGQWTPAMAWLPATLPRRHGRRRIGASGLVAGLMVLLLKLAALLGLAALAPTLLIWSAVWGIAPLLAIAWFPYLRAEGSGGFHRLNRQPLLQNCCQQLLCWGC